MNLKYWLNNPSLIFPRINYKIYEYLHQDEPWISPRAVRFLEENISNGQIGFEWGSGRRTIWLAVRLKRLISVEHDKIWFERLSRKIKEKKLNNIEYHYVSYEQKQKYVGIINNIEDNSLDIVFVDGAHNKACILAAIPKIKKGGLLLIDDTNHFPLSECNVPKDWAVVHHSKNVSKDTTVVRKP